MSDSDLDAELNAEDTSEGQDPPEPQDPPKSGDGEGEPGPDEEKTEPTVPVSVLTAEREEGRKRAEYWQGLAQRSAQAPEAKVDPVDFLAEPEKIEALINQKVNAATQALSKGYAVRSHGQKTVDEAHQALRDHGTPAEQQALSASIDPWGDAVDWHQKREALAEIGGDPAAWRKAETERITKELLAQAAVKQAKGIDPPASLAAEPNVGSRADTTEPDDSLDALLK